MSSPKHSSTRHAYQQGDNFCSICGKEIDNPVHILGSLKTSLDKQRKEIRDGKRAKKMSLAYAKKKFPNRFKTEFDPNKTQAPWLEEKGK